VNFASTSILFLYPAWFFYFPSTLEIFWKADKHLFPGVSWWVYNFLIKSRLGNKPKMGALVTARATAIYLWPRQENYWRPKDLVFYGQVSQPTMSTHFGPTAHSARSFLSTLSHWKPQGTAGVQTDTHANKIRTTIYIPHIRLYPGRDRARCGVKSARRRHNVRSDACRTHKNTKRENAEMTHTHTHARRGKGKAGKKWKYD